MYVLHIKSLKMSQFAAKFELPIHLLKFCENIAAKLQKFLKNLVKSLVEDKWFVRNLWHEWFGKPHTHEVMLKNTLPTYVCEIIYLENFVKSQLEWSCWKTLCKHICDLFIMTTPTVLRFYAFLCTLITHL